MSDGKERRRSDRKPAHKAALIKLKWKTERPENALVADRGDDGVRILSAALLRPHDSVLLYIGGEIDPRAASVVWVRESGVIDQRESGEPGRAYKAGCRFKTTNRGRQSRRPARSLRMSGILVALCGVLLVAGITYVMMSLLALFF